MSDGESAPWPVLVVDDDPAVLQVTRMVLGRYTVDGRSLQLDLCPSAAKARQHLADGRYALAIVDVVMETEHAGLDLVRDLRAEPRHLLTQVVVRTGQPGAFPESRVVQEYRISDFWAKDDLQPARIRAAVAGMIRSYQNAVRLESHAVEREALLREVHNRVKNNLQIVASLLSLQADQPSGRECRSGLLASANRVRAMALVHQQLYGHECLSQVDLAEYSEAMVRSLEPLMQGRAQVELRARSVAVPLELAVPVVLVLHEAVMNAVQHGQRDGAVVRVAVDLARDGDQLLLRVDDDGPGLPSGFEAQGSDGLGLALVRSLARQVRGVWSLAPAPSGACFQFRCPLPA